MMSVVPATNVQPPKPTPTAAPRQEARDAASRLVTRTCEAQGVPVLIADPAALARLAAFMAPLAA